MRLATSEVEIGRAPGGVTKPWRRVVPTYDAPTPDHLRWFMELANQMREETA